MIGVGLWEMPASYFADPTWLMVALAAMGFGVGILAGLFGVGGGFLITPLMVALLGVDASTAVGSGLCFMIGTSAAGLRRNMRLGQYDPVSTVILGLSGVAGTILGRQAHTAIKSAVGTDLFDIIIQLLYIPLLLTIAYMVYRNRRDKVGQRSVLQRLPIPPNIHLKRAQLDDVSLSGMVFVGISVGTMTGLLGVGGGVLYMPLLLLVVGLNVHQAVGTSLGVVLFNASAGALSHGAMGNVTMMVVLPLLLTSTIGVQIGVGICHRLHATRLRKFFALIVLAAVAVVVIKLVLQLTG